MRRRFQYYEVIEVVHTQAISPPRIPEYPAINEILNAMMAATVAGEKEAAPALREAAQEIESLLAERGYY